MNGLSWLENVIYKSFSIFEKKLCELQLDKVQCKKKQIMCETEILKLLVKKKLNKKMGKPHKLNLIRKRDLASSNCPTLTSIV
jgi:hypothetical protein